jgi:hypothetical protein
MMQGREINCFVIIRKLKSEECYTNFDHMTKYYVNINVTQTNKSLHSSGQARLSSCAVDPQSLLKSSSLPKTLRSRTCMFTCTALLKYAVTMSQYSRSPENSNFSNSIPLTRQTECKQKNKTWGFIQLNPANYWMEHVYQYRMYYFNTLCLYFLSDMPCNSGLKSTQI